MFYLNMFLFLNVGGIVVDYLIIKSVMLVIKISKFLNIVGFMVVSIVLLVFSIFSMFVGVILCFLVVFGFLVFGSVGFVVNYMDIVFSYVGIVMGVLNMAGILVGIIGVDMIGRFFEAVKIEYLGLFSFESWSVVFFIFGWLCMFSFFMFLVFLMGESIFDWN